MDRRVRERRRVVRRERGRQRAGLVFLGLLAVVGASLFLWLRSSDALAVKQIVASATRHVAPDEIAAAVAEARGTSLLRLSTGMIERRLAALPYVRSVHVYRRFPHSLEVQVEEYEAVARVRTSDGREWLVGDTGRVLEEAKPRDKSLPLVVPGTQSSVQPGQQVSALAVAALPVAVLLRDADVAATLPAVDRISVTTGNGLVVHLRGGAELRLGEPSDLKRKMMVGAKIIQQYLRDGKTLKYIDASVVDRVAVKVE
jgi:cell division protein FtsQ